MKFGYNMLKNKYISVSWVAVRGDNLCSQLVFRSYQLHVFYCLRQSEYDMNNKWVKNNKFKYDLISNYVLLRYDT